MSYSRSFAFRSLALLIPLTVALGCATSSPDDDAVADDTGELNVNVCAKGNELPRDPDNWIGKDVHAYGVYDAASGARIPFTLPAGNLAFNPVEFGVDLVVLSAAAPEAFAGAPVVDSSYVDACLGTVALSAHARVSVAGVTDPARIASLCAPNTVAGGTCEVRSGSTIGATLRAPRMVHGFMVTNANDHLRAGPSTNDAILALIPELTPVDITGELRDGFHSVRYQGKDGWVRADLLEPFYGYATTTDNLNVRSFPSTQASKLRLIPKGTSVYIAPGAGQFAWLLYDVEGNEAYISAIYLKDPIYSPGD